MTKIYGRLELGKSLPKDCATIDHVRSRPERGFMGETAKVLACHECNHQRNEDEKKNRPDLHDKHSKIMMAKHTLEKLISITGNLVDLPALLRAIEDNYEN